MGEQGRMFDALLHNTANVTRVRGGDKENVVPGEVTAFLDCRLVPGQEPADVIAELEALTGTDPEFEVVRYDPGPPGTDLGLFDDLAGHIEAAAEAVDWGTDRVYDAVDRGESRQSKNPRVR